MDAEPAQAVLITGVYGSGKSSAAQEIAYLLEERSAPYALLDLDFLGWANTGSDARSVWPDMMLTNLGALVRNYLGIGIQLFVLAGAVRNAAELAALKAVLTMPLRVVRLEVPLPEIEDRLRSDPTAGRKDDLREAATWITASVGAGLEDWTVSNDRPIRDVATDILRWLAWPEAEGPASTP